MGFICGQFSLLVVVNLILVMILGVVFVRGVVVRTGWKEVIVNLLVTS